MKNADNTKLTLTTTPRLNPIVSPAQSRNRQNTAMLGQLWSESTTLTKNGWQQTAQQINIRDKRTGRKSLTAYSTYVFLNRILLSCGINPLASAPQTLVPAAALPLNLALEATTTPASGQNGFGTFALMLRTSPYPAYCQVYSTKPSLANKPVRPGSGFVLLGALDSIPPGGVNIADLYLAKFGMPTSGAQIAVQIVPVSQTGLRGAPMLLQAIVDAPVAVVLTGDHELQKAA